jgi:hypothetical protein
VAVGVLFGAPFVEAEAWGEFLGNAGGDFGSPAAVGEVEFLIGELVFAELFPPWSGRRLDLKRPSLHIRYAPSRVPSLRRLLVFRAAAPAGLEKCASAGLSHGGRNFALPQPSCAEKLARLGRGSERGVGEVAALVAVIGGRLVAEVKGVGGERAAAVVQRVQPQIEQRAGE